MLVLASEANVIVLEVEFEASSIEFEAGIRSTLDVINQEQELLELRLSSLTFENDSYINLLNY